MTRSQFEAVHWSSVGSPHALDQEIMAYAAKHDYVVVTNDLDFGAILAVTHGEKPSVVQIRSENLSPEVIGAQTINALRQLADQLHEGTLEGLILTPAEVLSAFVPAYLECERASGLRRLRARFI